MFVPADFLGIGSREAVDLALHRLARKGTIRRLARGVYDFPKEHPALGPLSPSAEAVARALAGRDRTRLQPYRSEFRLDFVDDSSGKGLGVNSTCPDMGLGRA